VAYVFGNLAAGGAFDAQDMALSAALRKAWVAFAASGNPQLPQWTPYRPEADNHLELSDALEGGAHWRQSQLDFLERFFGR
jgi:carboxylesterase type B